MATDQEVGTESVKTSGRPAVGRAWAVASIVVGVMLVAWFFVAWLALDRHFVDAAGESVGTAFALLLAVSVVGAIRRGNS
jgi:hypothetical protein